MIHYSRTAVATLLLVLTGTEADTALAQQSAGYSQQDDPWYRASREQFRQRLSVTPNPDQARNVILFMADGMSVTLATAARIYEGQRQGSEGEEHYLSFERFPYTGLLKTFSANNQIPDSASTASAIHTGVKSHDGTVGMHADVVRGDCAAALNGHPTNIATKARNAGKAIGVVTTTIVQDATPGAVYAHSADRGWVSDAQMPEHARQAGCVDISRQLVAFGLDVVMGGGRLAMVPESANDPEADRGGLRTDGRNLIDEWQDGGEASAYVWTDDQLAALDLAGIDRLMGLFAPWSMVFEDEDNNRDDLQNPRLAQMTGAAIDVLSKSDDGYFLLVEHEGTDDLQHGGLGRRTLDAAVEFAQAVQTAVDKTDPAQTLILVTADHSLPLAFAGQAVKGNPVLGLGSRKTDQGDVEPDLADDQKPYTTLGFYMGPGASAAAPRPNPAEIDTEAPDYVLQAGIPSSYVPHDATDVPIYAKGPRAHLVGGVLDQTAMHHIILHAMGLVGAD